MDGGLLREMRLSKQHCSNEQRGGDPVAPGCEAELLTAPGLQQTFMNLKTNTTKIKELPQTGDESEYFYDEYSDYPTNETVEQEKLLQNKTKHYITGNTPTLYAEIKNKTKSPDGPKVVMNSPSSSGFTFFGVPLPSLNSLLGAGRKSDAQPTAQRKAAIVNLTSRGNGRGSAALPTLPEIQSGGFVPIVPGSGGFKPMINLTVTPTTQNIYSQTHFNKSEPLQSSTSTKRQYDVNNTKTETVYEIRASDTVEKTTQTPSFIVTTTQESEINKSEIEIRNFTKSETFENTFKETNEELPYSTTTIYEETLLMDDLIEENASMSYRRKEITNETHNIAQEVTTLVSNITPTTLTTFLIPDGQQPQKMNFKPPAGRSTITKVTSPHASANKPLSSSLKVTDTASVQKDDIITEAANVLDVTNDENNKDMSWYFTNYNKSNLEPYVGYKNFYKSGGFSGWERPEVVFLCLAIQIVHYVC